MTYINGKYQNEKIETIDQFDTHREAQKMLSEYQLAFVGFSIWLSSRSTKEWRTSK
jgi:hypothetical protein